MCLCTLLPARHHAGAYVEESSAAGALQSSLVLSCRMWLMWEAAGETQPTEGEEQRKPHVVEPQEGKNVRRGRGRAEKLKEGGDIVRSWLVF